MQLFGAQKPPDAYTNHYCVDLVHPFDLTADAWSTSHLQYFGMVKFYYKQALVCYVTKQCPKLGKITSDDSLLQKITCRSWSLDIMCDAMAVIAVTMKLISIFPHWRNEQLNAL